MKMKLTIRKRYLRFLLPAVGVLLLLALLLLWLSGFGVRYLFKKPVSLSGLSAAELPGSYVTLPVKDAGEVYTFLGYQDDAGNPVITEEYTVCQVEGKYLIIRVTKKDLPTLEKYLNAADLVRSGELGSVLEANLGTLTGTVNRAKKDPEKQLRSWLTSHQIDALNLKDNLNGADLSAYPGADKGDYDAYLDEVILPLELDVGNLGVRSAGAVRSLTVLALLLVLLALALLATLLAGLWEKPLRQAVRQFGLKRLTADYEDAAIFGPDLRIGRDFIWVYGRLFTRILETKDVIWTYPRSRRLEGGKQRWSLVLKTDLGAEAAAKVGSEPEAEQAVACLRSRGYPITAGFDKEKLKLYKKDLTAFRNRVRNGSI